MVTHAGATPSPKVRSGAYLRAALLMLAVVAVDQLTKHTIASGIDPGVSQKFLPAINFVHVRNTGVAFGFLSGGGAIVLIFTLAALAVLVGYFVLRPERPWLWVPTGMLLGGAISAVCLLWAAMPSVGKNWLNRSSFSKMST